MKGRNLLALPALVFALSCGRDQQPMGPGVPSGPSEVIRDGAHGGDPDFFFLPPLVPSPIGNPNFELEEFNNTLGPSLRIEICELRPEHLNSKSLPTDATRCVKGNPLKTFPAGSVSLVNLPQLGWWTLFDLPPDGFYYVLWNTRQSNLNINKFYRITVLINGSDVPLGIADVDPMSSLREWRHSRTGEVVQMIDDVLLPIPFRVEQSALCEGGDLCTSVTVTNDNPDGDETIVQVTGDDGVPFAGVLLPDGWLPANGPQSVVFTITRVNTGVNNVAAGTQQFPCHGNLPLQQFDSCFNYSTIPELQPIDETGRQFAEGVQVIAAVCFVLHDTEDPREPWVQLWSSEPGVVGDEPKPLRSADPGAILTNPDGEDCETQTETEPITYNGSNPLARLASAGWQKLKGGAVRLFSVKTAYAVDLGIGGIIVDISNIGPALTARIESQGISGPPVAAGAIMRSRVRILGTQVHDGGPLTAGINGMPVTFTVVGSGGGLTLAPGGAVAFQGSVTANTSTITTGGTTGAGFADVYWKLPITPGLHRITATGQALGGPITFSATVP